MQEARNVQHAPRLRVKNVGGINETSVTFSPGVTVLTGRNASNRTSLLQAVMAACGSTAVSLKTDAETGLAELEVDGRTYTRELERDARGVHFDGRGYLEDPDAAELFSFLLEQNDCRQAVARGDELRDLIMAPVDTEEIEAEIDQTVRRRRKLDDEISTIEAKQEQLIDLEAEREDIQEQLKAKRAERNSLEAELEAADGDVDQHRKQQDEAEDLLEELKATRTDLDDVRYRLETERESIEALEEESKELRSTLETLPAPDDERLSDLKQRRSQLRERKSRLEAEISSLQNVVQFNERMLEADDTELLGHIGENDAERDKPGDSVTEQLVEADETRCWTCGTQVAPEQISETVDDLRAISRRHVSLVDDIEEEINEVADEITTRRNQQERREEIEQRLEQIETELERRQATISDLEAREDSLQETIADLEEQTADLDGNVAEDVLETHQQRNRTEFELTRLEDELVETEQQIEALNQDIERLDDLRDSKAELDSRLTELRTRIEQLEENAVEEFNNQMETVLELLEYENIARIWLERRQEETRQGRQKVTKSRFDMHVVRSTDGDAVYEDTIGNLSESEREVVGLVFALAGYLTHEIYEEVPFMLLDSLEAIDSERIALLINHFQQYADYLVVALLEEDAQALSDEYHRIDEI